MQASIIDLTEQYSFFIFAQKVPSTCYYHNWEHTLAVVSACKFLAQKTILSDQQHEALIIAAYLHDVGYALSLNTHEAAGVIIAKQFLHNNNYAPENIKQVTDCIAGTQAGCSPKNIIEQILKDADHCSLGSTDAWLWSERLRLEWECQLNKTYTDAEWLQLNIDFYENHSYYTPTAQQLYNPIKQINLKKMRQLLASNAQISLVKHSFLHNTKWYYS